VQKSSRSAGKHPEKNKAGEISPAFSSDVLGCAEFCQEKKWGIFRACGQTDAEH
jgi:hypothetical protein